MRAFRPSTAAALTGLLVLLTGCSGDEDQPSAAAVDPAWYEALDAAVADTDDVGPLPVLSRGDCAFEAPEIDGEEPEGVPDVGVSTLGDSGHRLICSWSGPSVDLVVSRFDDPDELEAAREEVGTVGEVDRGLNVTLTEAVTVGDRDFFVRRTTYPTNDSHVDYAAWYLDDEAAGMVLLDVETTDDRDLIETYDSQQAAEDLAALLG